LGAWVTVITVDSPKLASQRDAVTVFVCGALVLHILTSRIVKAVKDLWRINTGAKFSIAIIQCQRVAIVAINWFVVAKQGQGASAGSSTSAADAHVSGTWVSVVTFLAVVRFGCTSKGAYAGALTAAHFLDAFVLGACVAVFAINRLVVADIGHAYTKLRITTSATWACITRATWDRASLKLNFHTFANQAVWTWVVFDSVTSGIVSHRTWYTVASDRHVNTFSGRLVAVVSSARVVVSTRLFNVGNDAFAVAAVDGTRVSVVTIWALNSGTNVARGRTIKTVQNRPIGNRARYTSVRKAGVCNAAVAINSTTFAWFTWYVHPVALPIIAIATILGAL
jgi:hypothetical protein